MKLCERCGNQDRLKDGTCRPCKNVKSALRYRENKEKIAAYHAALYASKIKDPEYRKTLVEKSRAYRKQYPEKIKEQNMRRRAKDPEKAKAENRGWFKAHPEKRRFYEQKRRATKAKLMGNVSHDIEQRLFHKQSGKCACCKQSLKKTITNLDHIMPLALGGPHDDSNLQLLCRQCNNQKYAKHPVDFMRQKGFLL